MQLARPSQLVSIARQQRIQLAQNPRNGRYGHDQPDNEHPRHAQKHLTKSVRTGINPAIRKDQVHGLLALFRLNIRKKLRQALSLVWHGIELFVRIQPVEPLEVPGTDPTSAVIKHHRLIWARRHIYIVVLRIRWAVVVQLWNFQRLDSVTISPQLSNVASAVTRVKPKTLAVAARKRSAGSACNFNC